MYEMKLCRGRGFLGRSYEKGYGKSNEWRGRGKKKITPEQKPELCRRSMHGNDVRLFLPRTKNQKNSHRRPLIHSFVHFMPFAWLFYVPTVVSGALFYLVDQNLGGKIHRPGHPV